MDEWKDAQPLLTKSPHVIKKMMSVWSLDLPLAQHETDVPNNYLSLEPIP